MSTFPLSPRCTPRSRSRVVGVLTTIGVLAEMVAPNPASAEVLTIALSKSPSPTYGTEHLPSPSNFSARVWSTITTGNTAYVGGEFTSLAPTTAAAGAIDGQSGAPQSGFPKVDGGQVNVATADGKGGWFVGGSFPSMNNVQVNGLAHVLADGTLDANFTPALVGPQNQPSKSFSVTALAATGPWLYVGGEFTKFGAKGTSKAQTRNHIARVSSTSGTVDPDWDPDTGNNAAANPVRSIAVSPDGATVYLAGDFSTLGGQPRPGVGAFTSDAGGNHPSTWAPSGGAVATLGISPDGSRIYLGAANGLTAVDPAGATLWNTATAGGGVKELAVARDGSGAWIGGDFKSVGGQARTRLASVHSDGAVDPTFNPALESGATLKALTASEDNSRLYFGGAFSKVGGAVRNNLAAVDSHSGALTPWDPNATGEVASLTASGSLVYAGGTFTNLGATPRTYLGAIDLTPGPGFGAALPFAPKLENLGSTQRQSNMVPPVVQALDISPDGSRLFVGGNFDHVNGVARTNFAVLRLPGGEVDPAFDAGEPQGTVRAVHYEASQNLVYIGGDFDSIQIPGSARLHRPDNDATCGTPQHKDSTLTPQNRCIWKRSKIAALDGTTGVIDMGFSGPTSTGPGLIGNGGKTCGNGTDCGTGAVLSLQLSPDKHQLFASGSFSELDNNKHRNTIMALYADGPNRGRLTPWQPQAPASGIPIFDCKVAANGMLFGAGGGAGGRAIRWDPQIGSGAVTYNEPVWVHLFDGDSTSVDVSDTTGYWGGHYDFVDGGAFRRKHGVAIDFNGNIAQNWDPEFDTNEGVFNVEVVPGRGVIYGGNFSRVNRRPQPGIAVFLPEAGGKP